LDYKVFEIDFIQRTQDIIDQYDKYVRPNVPMHEQFEVTLLINSLLGLLVLPETLHFERIPDVLVSSLSDWGLQARHVLEPGRTKKGKDRSIDTLTVKELVTDMRDSVAHILFRTYASNDQITDIELHTDYSRIKVKLSIDEFKQFITKLADSVSVAAAHNKQNNDAGTVNG
jgi:hypothetical protein